MSRPQIPPELVRQKEVLSVQRQVLDFLKARSMERGMERRRLIEEILTNWCKRQGLKLVQMPAPVKRVIPSVS